VPRCTRNICRQFTCSRANSEDGKIKLIFDNDTSLNMKDSQHPYISHSRHTIHPTVSHVVSHIVSHIASHIVSHIASYILSYIVSHVLSHIVSHIVSHVRSRIIPRCIPRYPTYPTLPYKSFLWGMRVIIYTVELSRFWFRP